jgi:hypothetical protein
MLRMQDTGTPIQATPNCSQYAKDEERYVKCTQHPLLSINQPTVEALTAMLYARFALSCAERNWNWSLEVWVAEVVNDWTCNGWHSREAGQIARACV